MKINKYLLSTATLILFGISGCKDDAFLKESPTSLYSPDLAFSSTTQVKNSLTICYYTLQKMVWDNSDNSFYLGHGTDIMDAPFKETVWRFSALFSEWNPSNQYITNIYNTLYTIVSRSNFALSGVAAPGLTWQAGEKEATSGEARFFRGFAYLNLAEMWGGVPIVQDVPTSPKTDYTRPSRADSYRFAISDLEYAAKNLPNYPSQPGRIGKGAAYNYLAEAYLALAIELGNDKAALASSINAANEVLKLHSLMTRRFGSRAPGTTEAAYNGVNALYAAGDVYFDLFQRGNFDPQVNGNTESLWALQEDAKSIAVDRTLGVSHQEPRLFTGVFASVKWKAGNFDPSKGQADTPWPVTSRPATSPFGAGYTFLAQTGGDGGFFVTFTKYANEGVWAGQYATDIRNNALNIRRVLTCQDEKSPQFGKPVTLDMLDPNSLKYYAPLWTKIQPIDAWSYNDESQAATAQKRFRRALQDTYMARVANTILIRAEAKWRNGDNQGAADDINLLRDRAQCSYRVTAADVNLDLIFDEHTRELAMEESRWTLLFRMNSTQNPSNNVVATRLNTYAYYRTNQGVPGVTTPDGVNYDTKWILMPIPQSTIDANKDAPFPNNPGF